MKILEINKFSNKYIICETILKVLKVDKEILITYKNSAHKKANEITNLVLEYDKECSKIQCKRNILITKEDIDE